MSSFAISACRPDSDHARGTYIFGVVPDLVSGSCLISPTRGPGLVHLHHTSQTPRCSQRCSSTITVAELPITGLRRLWRESRLTKLGLYLPYAGEFFGA